MSYTYTAYDGQNPYLQVGDSTSLGGAGTPSIAQRFLYGAAVDQILATDDCNGTAGSVLWGLADKDGTVRDVVNKSGSVVTNGHIKFDSFGNPTGNAPVRDLRRSVGPCPVQFTDYMAKSW